MDYRLAYSAFGEVNWCEALGTVLANDEVVNSVSERGGHPVIKQKYANGICGSRNMPRQAAGRIGQRWNFPTR